jgi:hypothetical protein
MQALAYFVLQVSTLQPPFQVKHQCLRVLFALQVMQGLSQTQVRQAQVVVLFALLAHMQQQVSQHVHLALSDSFLRLQVNLRVQECTHAA